MLDDEEIVDILRKSKKASNEISKRIKATEKAQSKVQEARHSHLPVAARGARLYFLVAGLARLSRSYRFPLDWFRQAFLLAVGSASRAQQEPSPGRDKMSLKKTRDVTNLSKEPKLGSEENLSETHLKNSVDVLTRRIFKVRHPCL